MLTFYQYLAFLIPLAFVLAKGYFLSVEFSLYPYLVSIGLLPYKDIVDQHFPTVFFGTFSLPFLVVDSPIKLLLMLLGLNFLTTYLLLLTLKQLSVVQYQLWTFTFSLLLIFFSANTLWVETFVCFFLSLLFYFNTSSGILYSVGSGLIISQIFLLRPTMVPFLLGFFIVFQKHKFYNFFGGVVGLLLSFWYLVEKNLLSDFYQAVIIFNADVYSSVQSQPPTVRQLFSLILIALVFLSLAVWKKKIVYALLGISALALVYPRFGLEHLQVFGLVCVYLLSQLNLGKKATLTVFFVALLVCLQPLLSIFKVGYGNYFYTPDIVYVASQIKQLPDKNIYLYGASDLIYQLAEKLPPNNYYLPSLPWYLNYQPYKNKLFESLNSTKTVIVDIEFSVDGQKLVDTTPDIFNYIKMNYYLDRKIKHLEIYKQKP